MKNDPIRLPWLERRNELVKIWWSATRVPNSITSLSRCSLGDGGRLCVWGGGGGGGYC